MTNSVEKGKVGERELAIKLREHGFVGAARGQQHKGGPGSPDVIGAPGLHIECKRARSLELYPAVAQSHADAAAGEVAIVAHRGDGNPKHPKQWLAILDLDDFLLIWRELMSLSAFRVKAQNPILMVDPKRFDVV